MEIFYVLTKYVQSRLLQNCRMMERVKSRHRNPTYGGFSINGKYEQTESVYLVCLTISHQQTTFENIVAKVEIAHGHNGHNVFNFI